MNVTLPDVTPRINSSLLSAYTGQVVRLVGKLDSTDTLNGVAYITTSDGGRVTVKMHYESVEKSTYSSSFLEIVGKVNADRSIQEIFATQLVSNTFGKNFDMFF